MTSSQHLPLRASGTLRKIARHDVSGWALTGGLAVELHAPRGSTPVRELHDIDFVTAGFDDVPRTLASEFLFRHVHPADPPGKTLLQMIDRETRLRIDVFRAYGATMSRTVETRVDGVAMRLVSIEDLTARLARLVLDLAAAQPVERKFVDSYLRLNLLVNRDAVEVAWRDQRRSTDPATFAEANELLRRLIPAESGRLVTRDYAHEPRTPCLRCLPSPPLTLADPDLVHSLLGYY